jgi:hypothetical protein
MREEGGINLIDGMRLAKRWRLCRPACAGCRLCLQNNYASFDVSAKGMM